MKALSLDKAVRICEEIRAERPDHLVTWARGQCWACMKFSNGDPNTMIGGVVGCNLVQIRAECHRRSASSPADHQPASMPGR